MLKLEQRQKNILRTALFWCVALGVAVFSCARYYLAARSGQSVAGIDVRFHLNSIQGIYDGLKAGQFPVKIWVNALEGYGYAAPLFYPGLFLYLPALLMLAGVSLPLAYCIFLTLVCFAGVGTMYLFAKKFLKDRYLAFAAALLFVLGNYFCFDLVYRAGLSEAIALVFVPVVLHGLYNMFSEGFSKPWILLIGVVCVTYSHTITAVLVALFIIVLCLCYYKRFFFDKTWWKKVGILFLCYLLSCSYFFLPFLEQFLSGSFALSGSRIYPSQSALDLLDLFAGVSTSDTGISTPGLGLFALLSLFLRLFLRKTEENAARLKVIDRLLIVLAVLVFVSTEYFPWKLFETVLKPIQFSWRIYTIAAAILPVCTVLILRELFQSPKTLYAVNILLILCMAVYNFSYFNIQKDYVSPSYNYIGMGEWLPQNTEYDFLYSSGFPQEIVNNEGESVSYERAENSVCLTFMAESGERYTLPLLWYKGYTAEVTLADGSVDVLSCSASSGGLVQVDVPSGGTVTVNYSGTAIQSVSLGISAAAALASAVYFVLTRRKKDE